MSLIWSDPEDTRKRRPEPSAPLFEASGLSSSQVTAAQCETEEGAPTVSALRPTHSSDIARARRSDPATSHQAAASVTNLGRTRDAILAILRLNGPCTDEQIADIWAFRQRIASHPIPKCSPSGLRSRRSELVRLGLLEDSGKTAPTSSGRQSTIWRLK